MPVMTGTGRRWLGALAGLVAAAVGLGVGELVAAVVSPQSAPVVAVGSAAIPLTPEPVKQFAIQAFGTHDKTALVVGIVVLLGLYALAVGVVAVRSHRLGAAGILLFGFIGIVAAVTRPSAGTADGVPSFIGALAGIAVLLALVRQLDQPEGPDEEAGRPTMGIDRRRFFVTGGVAVGLAALAGGGGRLLQRRFAVAAAREKLTLPRPASPAPPLPASADLAPTVPGLTPLITRNADFYRIDTALTVPQVDPAAYRLSLTGMFDLPRRYTLAAAVRPARRHRAGRDAHLRVQRGRRHPGRQRALAGDPPRRTAPRGRHPGGEHPAGLPLGRRHDHRRTDPVGPARRRGDARLRHERPTAADRARFPVRMVDPRPVRLRVGLQVAGQHRGHHVRRLRRVLGAAGLDAAGADQGGVADRHAVGGQPRPVGRRAIAGVAWAQDRGVGRVEVQVDGGAWRDAQLSPEVGRDPWRQWVLQEDFSAGRHTITVRATDRRRRGADAGVRRSLSLGCDRLAQRPGHGELTAG